MYGAKYIRTNNDIIIVFSNTKSHSDFRVFEPISAGHIIFSVDNGVNSCVCCGDSGSLGIKSRPEEDTRLSQEQLLNK